MDYNEEKAFSKDSATPLVLKGKPMFVFIIRTLGFIGTPTSIFVSKFYEPQDLMSAVFLSALFGLINIILSVVLIVWLFFHLAWV